MAKAICTPDGTLLEVLGEGQEGEEQQNPEDNPEGEDRNCDGHGGPLPHRGSHSGRGGIGVHVDALAYEDMI